MNLIIDGLSLIILLIFARTGWMCGFKITSFRIIQLISALIVGYVSGRYFGNWFSDWAYRPRIITIPTLGLFGASLSYFIFHVIISSQIEKRQFHLKSHNFFLTLLGRFSGTLLSLLIAITLINTLLWTSNLMYVLKKGQSLPGAQKSIVSNKSESLIYHSACRILATWNEAHRSVAIATAISNPSDTVLKLKYILMAPTIQKLIVDPTIQADLTSGDINQLKNNLALSNLLNDSETLSKIREIGILSGKETKNSLYKKFILLAKNTNIQASLRKLKERNLLNHNELLKLIRDPEFDTIIAEFLKK